MNTNTTSISTKASDNDSELRTPFTDKNVPMYIRDAQETMSFVQKLRYNGLMNKEIPKQLTKIATDMLRKQQEQIEHKLMLGLDLEKKRLFNEHLTQTGSIQQSIIQHSTQATDNLIRVMNHAFDNAFKTESERVVKLEKMKQQGFIDDERYQEEVERTRRWTARAIDSAETKIALILEKHGEAFARTLELFKQEHINL